MIAGVKPHIVQLPKTGDATVYRFNTWANQWTVMISSCQQASTGKSSIRLLSEVVKESR
jgi:hypothetical protein